MRRASGRPRRRALDTFDDLLTQPVVLVGTTRLRGECKDGLAVSRTLFKPDTLADRRVENSISKGVNDRLLNVAGERCSLVVKGDDRPEQLELRIGPGPDLVDGLQEIIGAFKGKVAGLHRDQEVRRRNQGIHGDEAE